MARPKGSPNKIGLTLDKRIKILSKIACNKESKDTDIIAAVKQITDLLNDRIKEAGIRSEPTVIKFEDTKKIEEKPVNTIKCENNKENTIEIQANTTTSTTTTLIIPEEIITTNSCNNVMTMEISKENINIDEDTLNINFIIKEELDGQ